MKPTAEEWLGLQFFEVEDINVFVRPSRGDNWERQSMSEIMEAYAAAVKSEPADDDEKIELGEPDKLKQQPTAEGAEEIIKEMLSDIDTTHALIENIPDIDIKYRCYVSELFVRLKIALYTMPLHAQRLADKMVEERMPKEEEATEQIKTYEPVYKEALYMEGCVHGFMAAWRWFRSRMKGGEKC